MKTPNTLTTCGLPLAVLTASVLMGCGSSSAVNPLTRIESSTLITQVTMRDGIDLYTEILLPADAVSTPMPTLLLRTPYDLPTVPLGGLAAEGDGDEDDEDPEITRATWQPILDRGYAVVFQNLRGTQSSGGINELFNSEREDGVDTLNWIREQPWSNGRVGGIGDSAAGFSMHLLAAEQPAGLEATFSQASCGNIWGSAILPDHGGLKLEAFLPFMLSQSLEVSDEHIASLELTADELSIAEQQVSEALGKLFGDDEAEQFEALSVQPFIDYSGVSKLLPAWKRVLDENQRSNLSNYFDTRGASAVPGMHVTLWQDIFVECALGDFQALVDTDAEQRLLILDGSHYDIDDAEVWPYLPMLDWFDRHLKDTEDDSIPTVQYAMQSASSAYMPSEVLIDANTWPPANSEYRIWVPAENEQLTEDLNAGQVSINVESNPFDPQSTFGGRHLVLDSGVAVQPDLEASDLERVYATQPLENGADIAGEIKLIAKLVTDLPNVDVHARLVEVTADNQRVLIVDGMQRARFAADSDFPVDLVPGQSQSLTVSLGNIAHRVSQGSRLQLEINPTNFPSWDINPQVSGSSFTAIESQAGTYRLDEVQILIPIIE